VLGDLGVHPTIPANDIDRAQRFYEGTLGLPPGRRTPGGFVYGCPDGTWFLLYATAAAGTAEHTVMAWTTPDIEKEVADLKERGVVFEEYDTPAIETVNSIARFGPIRSAWFKDSEGNILGLVQYPA
jgi:catechol 2,3-dioxygenase-like lactoylglutathione lyase family enzyme